MPKLTEKERTHITWFFILGSLALILWLIGFFFEYGNLFIEDTPGNPPTGGQKVQQKYRPTYDPTQGEK